MKIARSLSFCQKTIVFPTTCVLTPQNTSRPKVSMRKLSPSGRKGKARQACLSRPKGAVSCRILPSAKQAGQAHRSAPHKILCKSPALPDFYASARDVPQGTFSCPEGAIHLAAARPRPLCGREGGIVSGFFGTGNVSRGDSVPLGYKQEKIAAEAAIFFLAFYLVARRRALASMRSRVTSSSTAPMITRPRTRF